MYTKTRRVHARVLRMLASALVALGMVFAVLAPTAHAKQYLPVGRPGMATAPDGVQVSYFEYGQSVSEAPTIVITGTWPWNSEILEPLTRILAQTYHVVRYDQRGYGASGKPQATKDYELPKLAAEFGAVINKVAPHKRVHVFGFEWGSYTFSEYVHLHPGRIASFTSVGMPSIDISSQRTRDAWKDGSMDDKAASVSFHLRQSTYYTIGITPLLPDLAILSGLPTGVFNAIVRETQGDWRAELTPEEVYYGRKMLTANLMQRQLHPQYNFLNVPLLQVIDLSRDSFSTDFVNKAMENYTKRLILRTIRAPRNTIVTYPMSMAQWTHEAVRVVESENPTVGPVAR